MVDKTTKVLRSLRNKPMIRATISNDYVVPNHSGDLSAGDILTTPVNDYDPVNKKYVDDSVYTLPSFTSGSVIFSNGSDLAQDNTNFFWDDTNNVLTVERLAVANSNGLEIATGSAYAFTRTGDLDTGLYFDVPNLEYEFHRDADPKAGISAGSTWSFKAYNNVALLIQDNSYAFVLDSAKQTGMFFNNTLGTAEFRNVGTTSHSFFVGTGNSTFEGELTLEPGTKFDGRIIGRTGEITTTNAVPQSLVALPCEDENTYQVEAYVVGVKSDGTDRAGYNLSCTAYRTGGANVVIQGQTVVHTAESNAAWNCTFLVVGTNLVLAATGVAATTIEWGGSISYVNISN